MAGIVCLLVVGGGGAFLLKGGGRSTSETVTTQAGAEAPAGPDVLNAEAPVTAGTENATANEAAAAAAAAAAVPAQPGQTPEQLEALRKQAAKAAAAEARLAAIQKAQAKAAQAAKAGTSAAATRTATAATSNTVSSESSSSSGGVSKAKLSQFYSIVDDARSQAKRVMRSGNAQNAALARSYDSNLATLRDSMRGINSDREADRLIAQAKQTRAYITFLVKQSQ